MIEMANAVAASAEVHDHVPLRGSGLQATVMGKAGDESIFLIFDSMGDDHSSSFSFHATADGCSALAQSLLRAAAAVGGGK